MDHGLVLLNLLLLLVVSVLPFPTAVLGDALFASAAFCALWLWASRGRRLIRDEMCDEAIRLRTWRMAIAVPAFAIDGAIMISFLLSDGWLEGRMSTLNGAVARRLT